MLPRSALAGISCLVVFAVYYTALPSTHTEVQSLDQSLAGRARSLLQRGGRAAQYIEAPLPSGASNVPILAPQDPVPGWDWYTATIDPSAKPGRAVPKSFLGTSHEWSRLTDWGANLPAFTNIFRKMGPNPILRLGGATQDKMTTVPDKAVWDVLLALHKSANVRYIIGLPMAQKNAYELSSKMMADAQKYLPPQALAGYELGNEPEFWVTTPTGLGGWTANGSWVPGFQGYADYFDRLATQLNPCTPSGPKPLLSGPGWGNVNTQEPRWFAEILKKGKCYLRESNVHYYPYVQNTSVDAAGLLSQELQDFGLDKFGQYERISRSFGLPIRISEANSLYGGGRAGFSETMVGTLWCMDALFAFANAGATGFHFHWGEGGRPVSGGQPNTGVQTNFDSKNVPYPSVHAPWFGYLFFMETTAGKWTEDPDTAFTTVYPDPKPTCKGNVKVWALLSNEQSIRAAVLNKDASMSCNMKVIFPPGYCGTANMARLLPGTAGMLSISGLSYKGMRYTDGSGIIQGDRATFRIKPQKEKDGRCTFSLSMPAASAALLRVRNTALDVKTEGR